MQDSPFLSQYPRLGSGVFIIDCQDTHEMRDCGVASLGRLTQTIFGLPDAITTHWNVPEKGVPSSTDIGNARLIIGTGSTHNTSENLPWMKRLKTLYRELSSRKNAYVFGTCFTHQLLAEAFGGRVEANPHGVEFGTRKLIKTPQANKHHILGNIPEVFAINQFHSDAVTALRPEWQLLAVSELCENQIIAYRHNVIGFQGHLEHTAPVMHSFITSEAIRTWLKGKGKSELSLKIVEASIDETKDFEESIKRIVDNILAWANCQYALLENKVREELSLVENLKPADEDPPVQP